MISDFSGRWRDPSPPEDAEQISVPELLKAPLPNLANGKQPIRLLACGIPPGVDDIVLRLHILGFAEVGEWSPPLPSPVEGEVIRILTRYCMVK
jgi:hypothetical protein